MALKKYTLQNGTTISEWVKELSWVRLQTDDVEVAAQIDYFNRNNTVIPMFGKVFVLGQYGGNSQHFNANFNEIRIVSMDDRDKWWQRKEEAMIQRIPNSDEILLIVDNTFYKCIPVRDVKK